MATTRTSPTCSQTDVQNTVNASASGDTVLVPACPAGVTWGAQVLISSKKLTLQGATTCTGGNGVDVTCVDNTVVNVSNSGSGINGNGASATNFVDVSGFTLTALSGHSTGTGLLNISGTNFSVGFRFHHNHIKIQTGTGFSTSRGIETEGVYGLIDHNRFDNPTSNQMTSITGQSIGSDGGFTGWQQPLTLGSINAVYVEDNTYSASSAEDQLDAYSGARLVIRKNTFLGEAHYGFHGTDSGNIRSPVSFEIYQNILTNNSGNRGRNATVRGGTGVIWGNNYGGTTAWDGVTLQIFRACPGSGSSNWLDCTGPKYVIGSKDFSSGASRTCSVYSGVIDSSHVGFCSNNQEVVCSSNADCGAGTCTTFFDGGANGGYRCRDQPGTGPGQVLAPIYMWSNTGQFSAGTYDGGHACPLGLNNLIQAGREYCLSTDTTCQRPGYTAFTYPHPLQGSVSGPPVVSFNPTSLTFANQIVSTASTPQTISLSNTGGTALAISGIAITGTNSGDYFQTNNCPGSLNSGSSCTINVTFTPSSTGTRTANVSVTDNAAGSPHTVPLTGTGVLNTLQITTTTLPNGVVGTPYSQTISATGGTPPYTWSIFSGSPPTNLVLGSTTGTLAGTPTVGGIFNFTVRVTDSLTNTANQAFAVTILAPGTKYVNIGSGFCSDTVHTSTPSLPYCTVDFAVTQMLGGDTLEVSPGTYSNLVYVGTGINGTASQMTTFHCNGTVQTCIMTTGTTSSGRVRFQDTSFIVFDGFRMTNMNQGLHLDGVDHFTVKNCKVDNVGVEGIHVHNGQSVNPSHDVTIQNCTVSNTGLLGATGEGVYVGTGTGPDDDTNHVTVIGNTISNTTTEGIEFKPGTHDNIADGNNISAWSTGGAALGTGMEVDEAVADSQIQATNPNQLVRNNIIHDGPSVGAAGTCSGMRLGTGATAYNNIFYNIAACGDGVLVDNVNSDTYLRLVYNNTVDVPQARAVVNTGSGAIVSNPDIDDVTVDQGVITCPEPGTLPRPAPPSWQWEHDTGTPGSSCGNSSLQASPSLDGQSRQFTVSWTGGGGERFHSGMGPAKLDPNSTSFVYDTQIFITDLTHINQLEFDNNQVLSNGTQTVIYGMQLNFANGFVQITRNNGGAQWINTTVPATKFLANAWHHLTFRYHRDATGANVTYDSIAIDGTTSVINQTVNSLFTLNNGPAGTTFINFQLNGDNTANSTIAYLDELSLTGITGVLDNRNNLGPTGVFNLPVLSTYFLNYAGHDYHLVNGAAPVNAGADLTSVVPLDIVGVNRSLFKPPDIGAYEFIFTAAPNVSFNPGAGLTFAAQSVGTTSAAQSVILTNTGTAALLISSIAMTGVNASDYAQTNNCPAALGAGLNCTISVTFTPTGAGTRTAAITVTDNATGSPHSVGVTGTGVGVPALTFNPASLLFALQTVGTTSPAQPISVTNSGSGPMIITAVSTTGDYAQTNNCPPSLTAGGSCTVNVTFTPTVQGPRTGTVRVTDNASGSPHTANLVGSGQASINNGVMFGGGVQISGGVQFIIPGQETFIYVSVATGNDVTGTGTIDNPVKTVSRGHALVVGQPGAHMVLRDGTYFLSGPVGLSSSDSSTHWEAFPSESPVVSGGFQVPAMTNTSGSTWTTNVDPAQFNNPPEQLFYNGVRRNSVRVGTAPLGTWLHIANTVDCSGAPCRDRFVYDPVELPTATVQAWINLHVPAGNLCGQPASGNTFPTGNIEVGFVESFTFSIQRISCVDTTNHIIYMTGTITNPDPNLFGYQVGRKYMIMNARTAGTLGQQTWFLDQSVTPWILTYQAALGENPAVDEIIVPRVNPPLVTGNGVVNMSITGLTFSHDNVFVPATGYSSQVGDTPLQNSEFKCLNCSGVAITGNKFQHTNGPAVYFTTDASGVCSGNTIQNNGFYDIGAGAILVGRLPINSADNDSNVCQTMTISNNRISGYGRMFPGSNAISNWFSHDLTMTHNDITDGFHDAIRSCNSNQQNCIGGAGSTGMFNTTTSFNLVTHIGQGILRDFGGIYSSTYSGLNNRILNNIIHDVNDFSAFGETTGFVGANCIYVDQPSQDVLVQNNLAYNCAQANLAFNLGPQVDGHPNTADNNIFAYARVGHIFQYAPPPTTPIKQYVATHNLLYSDRTYLDTPSFHVQGSKCGPVSTPLSSYQDYNHNLYFNTARDFSSPSNYTQAFFTSTSSGGQCVSPVNLTWNAWQSAGEDPSGSPGSVVQDPSFANAANRDFTLSGPPQSWFSVFSLTSPGLSNSGLVPAAPTIFQPWPTAEFPNSAY